MSIHDPSAEARTLAAFEGFRVPGREVLLCESDVLVTATGRDSAISDMDLPKLREGVFLANAGHSCDEIAAEIREHHCRRQVLRHVEEITTESGRHCFLLARGEMVNLGAGFGDTINGFDLTSAQLIQAVRYLLENGARLAPGWHELPRDFVTEVLS